MKNTNVLISIISLCFILQVFMSFKNYQIGRNLKVVLQKRSNELGIPTPLSRKLDQQAQNPTTTLNQKFKKNNKAGKYEILLNYIPKIKMSKDTNTNKQDNENSVDVKSPNENNTVVPNETNKDNDDIGTKESPSQTETSML